MCFKSAAKLQKKFHLRKPFYKKSQIFPFPAPAARSPEHSTHAQPTHQKPFKRPPNALLALSSPRPYSDHLDINTAKRRKQDENKTKTRRKQVATITRV